MAVPGRSAVGGAVGLAGILTNENRQRGCSTERSTEALERLRALIPSGPGASVWSKVGERKFLHAKLVPVASLVPARAGEPRVGRAFDAVEGHLGLGIPSSLQISRTRMSATSLCRGTAAVLPSSGFTKTE